MLVPYLATVAVIAYVIGSVPVGAMIAHFQGIDISQHGSGKTGTTNVLRTVGRRAAALVLLGDFLKGTIAVIAARLISPLFLGSTATLTILDQTIRVLTLGTVVAAVVVVTGHVFSLYLRIVHGAWKGGRGVVTAMGAAIVVNPLIVLAAVVVGVPTMLVSRYVSLGSIVGALAGGVMVIALVWFNQLDALSLLFVGLPVFVILAHRDNIERILKGTERKLGDRLKV